jgi:hypothetical protein
VESKRVSRRTVDLSAYPDLVVIYLGMRMNQLRGLRKLSVIGPQIRKSVAAKPEGLLLHEWLLFSPFPLELGMRQYWRDFASLEKWTRTGFHQGWWKEFLRDSGGTGFWHETYFMRGGMEAIYDDVPSKIGFLAFAPGHEATGSMFSARHRLQLQGEAPPAVVPEGEL